MAPSQPVFGGEIYPGCPPLAEYGINEHAAQAALSALEANASETDLWDATEELTRLALGIDEKLPLDTAIEAGAVTVNIAQATDKCGRCEKDCKVARLFAAETALILEGTGYETSAEDQADIPEVTAAAATDFADQEYPERHSDVQQIDDGPDGTGDHR